MCFSDFLNNMSIMDIKDEVCAVADRIQRLRKEKRLSQMNLSMRANISQGFLAMIETYQKVPTVTTILKLAHALDVHPSSFFADMPADREQKKLRIIVEIEREL